jgi:beta-phosphoglucomutase-like phosphatase (HAD superfamily)
MITRGVLLDIDGTLLDGNDAHATAWRRALHDEGSAIYDDPQSICDEFAISLFGRGRAAT